MNDEQKYDTVWIKLCVVLRREHGHQVLMLQIFDVDVNIARKGWLHASSARLLAGSAPAADLQGPMAGGLPYGA